MRQNYSRRKNGHPCSGKIFLGGYGGYQVKSPYKTQHALNSRLNGSNSFVMVLGGCFIDRHPFRPLYAILRRLAGSCLFSSPVKCKIWCKVAGRSVSALACVPACIYAYACVCRRAREKGLPFSSLSSSFSLNLSFSFILFFFLLSKIYIIIYLF